MELKQKFLTPIKNSKIAQLFFLVNKGGIVFFVNLSFTEINYGKKQNIKCQ